MSSVRILVLDDDSFLRSIIAERLERAGYTIDQADSLKQARANMAQHAPDIALLDVKLPDGEGTELIDELSALEAPVLMMTAHATVEAAVAALHRGARDYLEKPFSLDRLEAAIARLLEMTALRREVRAMRERSAGGTMIGSSPPMREVFALVERIAPADTSTVLVLGETGTGKGVLARAIHRLSPRSEGPFVTVTCSALAETIMESELFGHEKGAFTDARAMKRGLVELADHGTLFLDEIGELSPRIQSKLLQFIEDRTFRRVGGTRDLHVDARLVAATNRDLEEEVRAGRFRADLFYRLSVLPLRLPPLRERPGDVPDLAKLFIDEFNREFGRRVRGLSREALDVLGAYPWPGNVRELRNVLERAVLLADQEWIVPAVLPPELTGTAQPRTGIAIGPDGIDLENLERALLAEALRQARGNQTEAGRLLGLSRHQIRNRLKKYEKEE